MKQLLAFYAKMTRFEVSDIKYVIYFPPSKRRRTGVESCGCHPEGYELHVQELMLNSKLL